MVNTYDNNDSYHAIDDKDGGIFWSLMPPFTFCLVVLSGWPHYPYSIVEALHCSFSCVFTSYFQLSNRFMLRFDSLITVFSVSLMVLTWMIISSVGITIARYMKPLITDFFVRRRRTQLWFQVNKILCYVTINICLSCAWQSY